MPLSNCPTSTSYFPNDPVKSTNYHCHASLAIPPLSTVSTVAQLRRSLLSGQDTTELSDRTSTTLRNTRLVGLPILGFEPIQRLAPSINAFARTLQSWPSSVTHMCFLCNSLGATSIGFNTSWQPQQQHYQMSNALAFLSVNQRSPKHPHPTGICTLLRHVPPAHLSPASPQLTATS